MLKFIPVVFRKFSAPATPLRRGQRASNARLRAFPGENVPSDSNPSGAPPGLSVAPWGDSPRAAAHAALYCRRQPARRNLPEPSSLCPLPETSLRALSKCPQVSRVPAAQPRGEFPSVRSTLKKPASGSKMCQREAAMTREGSDNPRGHRGTDAPRLCPAPPLCNYLAPNTFSYKTAEGEII